MDSTQKILCATDFSGTADHALAWAGALARRWDASIELVHVVPPPSSSVEALATDAAMLDSTLFAAAEERVRTQAQQAEARLRVPVRPRVAQGDAHRALAAAAEELGARMIVVGARALRAPERWLLGSTAERLVRTARCPVAVIPSPAPEAQEDQQLARMDDERRPLRVLAGIDLGPAGDRILDLVGELRKRRACEVTLLHLYWPPE